MPTYDVIVEVKYYKKFNSVEAADQEEAEEWAKDKAADLFPDSDDMEATAVD